MGNRIKLLGGNYHYELPAMPSDEKEILFFNKKKKDQCWSIPEDIARFREMSTSEKKKFVERERDRWQNGVWFFNNGEPTYITGMNYDHLVYQTFEFGKPLYLDSQRHDFYFRDYVRKDDKCFGALWLKPRRYGMTAEEITESQYVALSGYGSQVGMVSNENKKTFTSIFRPLVDSYLKRPKYLRARIYMPNSKKPKKEMLFHSSTVKEIGNELYFDTTGDLNGWIIPQPTTVTAFDGLKLHKLTADEVWKWIVVDPSEFWGVHKKCLEDGGVIVGKASFLSTMGDSDDYHAAIECGIRMIAESDPDVRDENGRTTSGLYLYFIDAIYSMRKYRDQYGFINEDAAAAELANDLAKHPVGTKDYIWEKHRMPRTIEDAISSATGASIFDKPRLSKRLEIIKKMPKSERPYIHAKLNEHPDGKIELEPDNYGLWKFANLPYRDFKRNINSFNRFRKVDNLYFPPLNPEVGGGYDGVNFADVDVVSGNRSRAAGLFRQKFDYYGNGGINRYMAQLAYRPEEPIDAHYEVIKCCRLLGAPLMIDRAGLTLIKSKFIEHGMKAFLLKSPKDGIIGTVSDNQKKFITTGINRTFSYFAKPKSEIDIDWLNEFPFEDLLEDLIPYDKNKNTKFDVANANFLLEEALEQIKETSLRDMESSGLKNNPFHGKRNW